jgi:hypothetical protein
VSGVKRHSYKRAKLSSLEDLEAKKKKNRGYQNDESIQ